MKKMLIMFAMLPFLSFVQAGFCREDPAALDQLETIFLLETVPVVVSKEPIMETRGSSTPAPSDSCTDLRELKEALAADIRAREDVAEWEKVILLEVNAITWETVELACEARTPAPSSDFCTDTLRELEKLDADIHTLKDVAEWEKGSLLKMNATTRKAVEQICRIWWVE